MLPHIAGYEEGISALFPVPSVSGDRRPLPWADQKRLRFVCLLAAAAMVIIQHRRIFILCRKCRINK